MTAWFHSQYGYLVMLLLMMSHLCSDCLVSESVWVPGDVVVVVDDNVSPVQWLVAESVWVPGDVVVVVDVSPVQ